VVLRLAHQGEELGQDHGQHPRLEQQAQPARRTRGEEQLEQLVAHPLGRHGGQAACGLAGRVPGRRIELEVEHGSEAHGAQHPQVILGEAPARLTDGPDQPRRQVRPAAEGVAERARDRVEGQGVDREVPPGQILFQAADEGHSIGVTPVGARTIDAVGGHLHRLAVDQDRHGPVLQPGGDGPGKELQHLLGERARGDVVVVDRPAEQQVPHRPADHERLVASPGELPAEPDHLGGKGFEHARTS